MTIIEILANKIRDALHDSTITKTKIFQNKDKGFWDQLWTSLDTICDTEIAVKSFNETNTADFQKISYILSYGLLQALYLQQDAVCHLKESITEEKIDWKIEYPGVFSVRTIRNESTGHPTKMSRGDTIKIYAVIDRSSLSKDGFSYTLWSSGKTARKNVKFAEIVKIQENAIREELTIILKNILQTEQDHKKIFFRESLASLLPGQEPYSLSLLRQVAYDQLAWIAFQKFEESYILIKKKLEARYGPIKHSLRIPGTELLIDELDRIFLRIHELKTSVDDVDIDMGIYADALVEKLKELRTHLEEVDEEFKKLD